MFDFRIINTPDGNQIIDTTLKTPYEALTAVQMVEYIEMDIQLSFMDRLKFEARAKAERQRRRARNLFYRLACACGIL